MWYWRDGLAHCILIGRSPIGDPLLITGIQRKRSHKGPMQSLLSDMILAGHHLAPLKSMCEQTVLIHQGTPNRRPTFTHVPRVHSCSHHLSLSSPSKEVQLSHMFITLYGGRGPVIHRSRQNESVTLVIMNKTQCNYAVERIYLLYLCSPRICMSRKQ